MQKYESEEHEIEDAIVRFTKVLTVDNERIEIDRIPKNVKNAFLCYRIMLTVIWWIVGRYQNVSGGVYLKVGYLFMRIYLMERYRRKLS